MFALQRDSRRLPWRYRAQGKVPNTMIAISGGRVFLVDRGGTATATASTLVALDASSGEELCKTSERLGGQDALLTAHGVVLATGDEGTGRRWGRTGIGDEMVAYAAQHGKLLWSRTAPSDRAPVIVGGTVYAQRFAYDLRTGDPKTRRHPVTNEVFPRRFRKSHGCTMLSACPTTRFFRSGTAGLYDLAADRGVLDYGGIRTTCAINIRGTGGVLAHPDSVQVLSLTSPGLQDWNPCQRFVPVT